MERQSVQTSSYPFVDTTAAPIAEPYLEKYTKSFQNGVFYSETNLPSPLPSIKPITSKPSHKRKRTLSTSTSIDELPSKSQHLEASPPQQEPDRSVLPTTPNFNCVLFGQWLVHTWYFSPYPANTEAIQGTENDETQTVTNAPQKIRTNRTPKLGSLRNVPRSKERRGTPVNTIKPKPAIGVTQPPKEFMEGHTLWVCEHCFKYFKRPGLHIGSCTVQSPPGRKVYCDGIRSIYEVNPSGHKSYCQNLILFGKLFIDSKTVFFDFENFLFYVVTKLDGEKEHTVGFFSKEKDSFENNNLACIITFPPYQRQGFGNLMIKFSYELSKRDGKLGSPERPLSDLGLRTYYNYWKCVVIDCLLNAIKVDPTEIERPRPVDRFKRANLPRPPDRRLGANRRYDVVQAYEDGSAHLHLTFDVTVKELAESAHLTVNDAAFALAELGLLSTTVDDNDSDSTTVTITRALMIDVAKCFSYTPPHLDPTFIMI